MRSTQSPNLKWFSEKTNVKSNNRSSFLPFSLRIPCMKSISYAWGNHVDEKRKIVGNHRNPDCLLKKGQRVCNQGPSPPSIALRHLHTLYTTIPKITDVNTHTLSLECTNLILYKERTTLILPNCSLKLMSSKCSCFWLTTYVYCLVALFQHIKANNLLSQTYVILLRPFCFSCTENLLLIWLSNLLIMKIIPDILRAH
jgi:hypothetical protein